MQNQLEFKKQITYYTTQGKGKVIVLLHGFIEEGSMWNEVVQMLVKSYKVIVPDLPGFGKSEMIKGALSMETYAQLVAQILEKEKVKKAIVLGHSMGGYITLAFAHLYPQMLQGFGLINSHCFADSKEKKENRKKSCLFILKHGSEPFVTELYNHIFNDTYIVKNRKFIDSLIRQAARYSHEAIIKATEAMMNRKDRADVLKKALVPVLFINGKLDESAPIASTLKQVAYPAIAHLHFYQNGKHMSLFENKKETHVAVQKFVDFCGKQ